MGGYLMLGYDPDASRTGLMVNEAEAEQVRGVFKAFLQHKLLIPTLEQIHNRGWRMKSWTTRKDQHHAEQAFNRTR